MPVQWPLQLVELGAQRLGQRLVSEADAEQREPPVQRQTYQAQHLGVVSRQSRPWGEDQPIVALELLAR